MPVVFTLADIPCPCLCQPNDVWQNTGGWVAV